MQQLENSIVGIYGTEDEMLNGTRGGSSHCFAILVEGDVKQYQELICPQHGLTNVKFYDVERLQVEELAYQHGDMLRKAIYMLKAFPDVQKAIQKPKKEKDSFVISFIGASGAGKSTAALGTAFELKKRGLSVEYVDEVAKGLYYQGLVEHYIPNQTYIIAQQYTKLYDVMGKVDYIVLDAGLEISALHASSEEEIEKLALYLSNKLNRVNIFITRPSDVKFEEEGRVENAEKSKRFGEQLKEYLKANGGEFIEVEGSLKAIETAIKIVEQNEKQKKEVTENESA